VTAEKWERKKDIWRTYQPHASISHQPIKLRLKFKEKNTDFQLFWFCTASAVKKCWIHSYLIEPTHSDNFD